MTLKPGCCPACGTTLTRVPKRLRLDCAACGDSISLEWAGRYEAELDRLRQLVIEAGVLKLCSEVAPAVRLFPDRVRRPIKRDEALR